MGIMYGIFLIMGDAGFKSTLPSGCNLPTAAMRQKDCKQSLVGFRVEGL